jgi:hypothetical protein
MRAVANDDRHVLRRRDVVPCREIVQAVRYVEPLIEFDCWIESASATEIFLFSLHIPRSTKPQLSGVSGQTMDACYTIALDCMPPALSRSRCSRRIRRPSSGTPSSTTLKPLPSLFGQIAPTRVQTPRFYQRAKKKEGMLVHLPHEHGNPQALAISLSGKALAPAIGQMSAGTRMLRASVGQKTCP